MAHTTLMRFTSAFSTCILLTLNTLLHACGWSETAENTRLAMFKAQCSNLQKLSAYTYCADNTYLYKPENTIDKFKNCKEWQIKLGANIDINHIYTILYSTDAEQFESAYKSHTFSKTFASNTFVTSLLLPKHILFLDYISTAKAMEYNSAPYTKWESWSTKEYNSYANGKAYADAVDLNEKIKTTKDLFLKQRYAFLSLRYNFYLDYKDEVLKLYKTYFASTPNTILQAWAMYYMALSITTDVGLTNYYLSKVMVASDDKAYAALQHFYYDEIDATLEYTQTDDETGIVLAIACMRNPSPALGKLQEVHALIPNSEYFSFLVSREINKLEDWIFTPKYTHDGASVKFEYYDWYTNYDSIVKLNFSKDIAYLDSLKRFLIHIERTSKSEQKDFLNVAIAHLAFINDDIKLGTQRVNSISASANTSIVLQKNIQLGLINLKQNDITTAATKQQLMICFNSIEDLVEQDKTLLKTMYSLYRIVSKAYSNVKDEATAGLLFLKSERKKAHNDMQYYEYELNPNNYYNYIGYFERCATVNDMDNLIALIKNNHKTPFEHYISVNTTSANIDIYNDVKGTIAFRNNDLKTALQAFKNMPNDYWQTHYEYKNMLNENPFFPKALQTNEERSFNYVFNKTEFVTKLLQLQQQNTAAAYLQLGHAYFNVSYYGNAWMMCTYTWSSGESSYADYVFGNDRVAKEHTYNNGNYYYCTMAKDYYAKAAQLATNNEDKAMANLMIFECEYYDFSQYNNRKFTPSNAIHKLMDNYTTTEIYKKHTSTCGLLYSYIR
jgi:hypothetical protein